MRKIFIYSEAEERGQLICAYLKAQYGFNCTYCNDGENVELALENKKFDLIVIYNESDFDKIALRVANVLNDYSISSKLIVLGLPLDISFGEVTNLHLDTQADDLGRKIVSLLKISREELDFIKKPDYIGIPITSFYQLNNPCTDIYIRILKKSGDQYVKRIYAMDELDKEIIQKYEDLNLQELYVTKESYSELVSQILSQSLLKLIEAHKSGTKIQEVSADTFEINQVMLDKIGISPQTVQMAKASIKVMTKNIASAKSLGNLLKDILENKSSYSYKRSYLISLFFYKILPDLGWGGEDQLEQNLEKMTYVSFFHDLYIRDEILLKIMRNEQIENMTLDQDEIDLINNHANRVSTLVQSIPQCPSGIDVILRQHHGSSNGIGLPDKLSTGISPMAIVFVVIEDFSTRVLNRLEARQKLILPEIFEAMEPRYSSTSYKTVFAHLKKSFNK